jgi:hypothetical protein
MLLLHLIIIANRIMSRYQGGYISTLVGIINYKTKSFTNQLLKSIDNNIIIL